MSWHIPTPSALLSACDARLATTGVKRRQFTTIYLFVRVRIPPGSGCDLNIADDYFKAKKQGTSLENDIEEKDKDMYELKHDLISVQIKLENAEKAMDKLKEENKELQLKIVQLETENKNK